MANSFYFGSGSVTQRIPVTAGAGVVYNASYLDQKAAFANTNPQALQTYTIVFTTQNSTTYTFTVEGQDVSYTSDASATNAEIGEGLVAAAGALGDVGAYFRFTYPGSGTTVTATAYALGTDASITDDDSNLVTTETVAPATATAIPFGRAVVNLFDYVGQAAMQTAGLMSSSALEAQVDTLTVVYAAGEVYYVSIAVAGQAPLEVAVAANTDTATTTTDIVTAINARMPSSTVLAASSVAGTITLTAEKAGLAFVTGVGLKSGTASRLSVANTTYGPLTDINKCFAGVAIANYVQPGTTVGVPAYSYAANSIVDCLQRGTIWVASAETVSASDSVWVETASGDDAGKFYTTGSSTRLQLLGARWLPKPSYASGQDVNAITLL